MNQGVFSNDEGQFIFALFMKVNSNGC